MTLPPSLSELDAESEPELELSRVTLVVGGLSIDLGLPPNVSIADFIADVIDIANEQLAMRPELAGVEFDNTEGKWTLSRLAAESIDPSRSLSDANVHDGDLLAIRQVGQPISPLLFDDVTEEAAGAGRDEPITAWLTREARPLAYFCVGVVVTLAIAFLLPRHAGDLYLSGTALGLGVLGVLVACVLAYRSAGTRRTEWVAALATPLVFGGSLYVVPDGFGVKALPMAFALTALTALLVLLVAGRGRALHTTIMVLAVIGSAAATVELLWHPPDRSIGALLAAAAVGVVYLSPRLTILLSKLPIPRVPTAGEPLDDIETQGGTTVEGVSAVGKQIIPTEEGMIARVRRANEYLTGILVASAVAAIAGCYLALDVRHGFYWQGMAFSIATATVLCLRGRSHHDLAQSATLIGSGLIIAVASIVKTLAYVDGWQLTGTFLLVVLMALVVACGVIAPQLEFSPVMRRQVEILEYVAIALVFPLCCWIIRLYAFFRELRI